MNEEFLTGLGSIIILGIVAQWLGWRFQLPAILLMVVLGIVAGHMGLIDPDEMFGDLLLPIVALSVAVILFEGSLNLRIAELRQVGSVIRRLIIVGAGVTWLLTTIAAYWILDFQFDTAILLGAILVVSGPTVVLPLLRHVRPIGQVGPIVKWEGIVIDPIGAMLAVLVFEATLRGRVEDATWLVIAGILKTIAIGGIAGIVGAMVILFALRRYWIPDFLQSAVALMIVITAFTVADRFQEESGLVAATVMGFVMGNQRRISVRHIVEFKENLGVILVSGLFILLAARLDTGDFSDMDWQAAVFVALLILFVRPLAVLASTIRSSVTWRERAFITWMAPRGIVAAAVASVFALRLADTGHPDADELVPVTFLVIICTVAIYGLTVSPLARWLRLAKPNPQGFLIVGSHGWAREIATALKSNGYHVLVVDTDWGNLSAARSSGLHTFYASILSQYALDEINLGGIGRLIALTPSNTTNSLAALHFAPFLGRANVFQLVPAEGGEVTGRREPVSQHLRGRLLFGPDVSYDRLSERFASGAIVKTTPLTEKFDYEAFKSYYGETAIPLFVINEAGNILVFTTDSRPTPKPGQTLISIVDPVAEQSGNAQKTDDRNQRQ